MKRFIVVYKDEDFEDTGVNIYEAESEEQVHDMVMMEFFEVKSLSEVDDDMREEYEGFSEEHEYLVKELDSVQVTKSSDFVFESGLKNLKTFKELNEAKQQAVIKFSDFKDGDKVAWVFGDDEIIVTGVVTSVTPKKVMIRADKDSLLGGKLCTITDPELVGLKKL